MKNTKHAQAYDKQMVEIQELEEYKGPIHYISHNELLRPESKSTLVLSSTPQLYLVDTA